MDVWNTGQSGTHQQASIEQNALTRKFQEIQYQNFLIYQRASQEFNMNAHGIPMFRTMQQQPNLLLDQIPNIPPGQPQKFGKPKLTKTPMSYGGKEFIKFCSKRLIRFT